MVQPTHTEGDRAYGIFAQSVGGGGGDGGFSVAGGITKEAAVSFAMGGNGSTGGMGGLVIVANSSSIETEGDLAHGILAQSIGGGGGAGGFSMAGSLALSEESKQISVAIGGDGGGGGSGSNVLVFNSGSIVTLGERANGIFAQSVGGGGGDGGEAKVMNDSLGMAFTNSGSAGTNDKGWSLSIAIGAGGNGGSAGNGGVVVVTNLGSIYTGGSNSIGILAQSVGGGGGSGGLSATDASGGGGNTSVSLNFGLGGAGGGGGAGNIVTVVNQGAITTVGDASHGIFAQSVGGGGGLGGASTPRHPPRIRAPRIRSPSVRSSAEPAGPAATAAMWWYSKKAPSRRTAKALTASWLKALAAAAAMAAPPKLKRKRRPTVLRRQRSRARVADFNDRRRADRPRRPHQLDGELIGHINHVEQDAVPLLQPSRVLDQQPGQLVVTRVGHKMF